jgi:predicted nucleic acid-binding protein
VTEIPNAGESTDASPSSGRIGTFLPSHALPALVGLAQSVSALSPVLQGFVRFHLVLDANILQEELRWRLGKRQKPHARTRLHEAIVSGVLVAYAPAIVEQEILEHAEEIAVSTRTSVAEVQNEWRKLLALLRIYPLRSEPVKVTQVVDADDLPYIAARDQLGLRAVYTRDGHFERMSSLVVTDQIDLFLRDYARASAVKIGITLGSTTASVISIETIPFLYRFLTSGISWIRRQSTGMQLAIVGIALALAIHPKSRAKFAKAWRAIAPTISKALRSTVFQLIGDYAEAIEMEEANRLKLEAVIPRQQKRTVLMHVRAVCLIRNRPMTLQQISAAIRANGYRSDSPHADLYLRRVLKNSREFSEIQPNVWTVRIRTR